MHQLRRISPICPKCNEHNTYDIFPDLPNDPDVHLQPFEYSIDSYSLGNAKYYCINCDYSWKKYRGRQPYKDIKVIYAEIGGYPGPNYQVKIDLYYNIAEHMSSFYDNAHPCKDIKVLNENDKEWFLSELYKCDFLNWSEEYHINGFVMDGCHWSIRIEYSSHCEIKFGNNHFPTKWTKFRKAISKITENEFQ